MFQKLFVMRIFFSFCLVIISFSVKSQLTVEKIMKDQKWIGTSPSGVFWSWDNKSIYFNWNPDKNISDSPYVYSLSTKEITKAKYSEAQLANAITNGTYNSSNTQLVYSYKGDIFLLDIKTNKTIRVTQTEEAETNPKFIGNDEWIAFSRNQNLYGWNIKTGITQQFTNIVRSAETPAAPAVAGGGFGGGGGRGGGGNAARGGGGNTNAIANNGNQQDQFLQQQQLATSDILKQRKEKREARNAFLKTIKDDDTLKTINIGDRTLQSLQISPDGRFVTYRLFTAPTNAKNTIVPDYVTESGYTTDINNRTKVGTPQGRYDFYVYDKKRDTVMMITVDSLPGITDAPDYYKDYKKFANRRAMPRNVTFGNLVWNESGSNAILDIRSQDYKDRWIVLLNAENGKIKSIDRQRDEAWIGGPGTSGFGASIKWINDDVFYFQSEATGYSHLYTYNINTSSKTQLTQGKYEVQDLWLSKTKQYFYLVTNEEHPGKQNWYKIKIDGTGKEKISNATGGYEVALSPDEKYIAYRYSYINKPWELFIQENVANKKSIQITNKAQSDEFKSYAWRENKIFSFSARDGQPVYARLYEPKKGTKNNAAVIFVHGAGYLQNVHYWWSNNYPREYMFNNLLADKGYTVIDIDYRGSAGYGRDWRTGIYRFMGGKDLDDEVDAAHYLVKELGIDSTRIGMYGGSYGGFMTLMAMFTAPDVIKAGAALRPVTDWAHYNHGYTANILNEPFNDSIAYAKSSPINFANGLKNHLLICHGMVDQNVNFQDAVRLNQRLIELGKDNWSMAVYPVEDHGFVEPSSWTDEYKRILKLFDTWLR